MAFTERYVTVAGGGDHDGTSEADAWTFAEMIAALAGTFGGYRVNMKAGSYSSGAASTAAGVSTSPFIIRGYNSTPGDLDDQGRTSVGLLDTTDMPDLTLTGVLTMNAFAILQNLDITGALSGPLIGDTSNDDWGLLSCRVVNTQNHASASCAHCDDRCWFLNCDFECIGASHSRLILGDIMTRVMLCRFKAAAAARCLEILSGIVERSVFHGNSGAVGIYFDSISSSTGGAWQAISNTFYGIGTAIETNDAIPHTLFHASHNHTTDCAKWLDNAGSASRNVSVVETRNRLRDITTPRTGIESIVIGEITIDTGGHATDYVDAPGGDFRLISTAAGYSAGLNGQDIGAMQHADPVGGGGTPVVTSYGV